MHNSITEKINAYYDAIRNGEEGDSQSRYRSWDYCHKAFLDAHKKQQAGELLSDEAIDFLALHLAFFLASWGMYRASSFLLQRDYKTHIPAVELIMKSEYDILWNLDPKQGNIDGCLDLLFGKGNSRGLGRQDGLIRKLIRAYKSKTDTEASVTLVTKILLGTFGCLPAYDSYLKSAISHLRKTEIADFSGVAQKPNRRSCKLLFGIVSKEDAFYPKDIAYPPMKCLDMFLWQIGKELNNKKRQNAQ